MKSGRLGFLGLGAAMLCAMGVSTSGLADGVGDGGGGDPLRFYFAEGRDYAAMLLRGIEESSFDGLDPEAASWIMIHREELEHDISASNLEWTLESQETCAWTRFQKAAPISLSFTSCRSINSKEEAGKLLIHESTHHLGNRDERLADSIARSVYAAWERTKLKSVPLCEGTFDTFPDDIINRKWDVERNLSAFLLGSSRPVAPGSITFTKDESALANFPGFGGCGLKAGRAQIDLEDEGKFDTPFVITQFKGYTLLAFLRPDGVKPPHAEDPAFPEHPEIQVRKFSLIQGRSSNNTMLMIGHADFKMDRVFIGND